jgi:hypothetical protein
MGTVTSTPHGWMALPADYEVGDCTGRAHRQWCTRSLGRDEILQVHGCDEAALFVRPGADGMPEYACAGHARER